MSALMKKQYDFFIKNKSENESRGPIDKKNMLIWVIHFIGPKNSDYEGGKFHIEVNFSNLPERPKCKFLNCDLLHPNIND